jgi:hypothetical protein
MAADDAGLIDAGLALFLWFYSRLQFLTNAAIANTGPTVQITSVAAYLELLCRKCYRKHWIPAALRLL